MRGPHFLYVFFVPIFKSISRLVIFRSFDPFANFIVFILDRTGTGLSLEGLIGPEAPLINRSILNFPLRNLVGFGRFLVFHGEIIEVHLLVVTGRKTVECVAARLLFK